jgi:type III pantothenate kinase
VLLAIDVGNTNVVIGLFSQEALTGQQLLTERQSFLQETLTNQRSPFERQSFLPENAFGLLAHWRISTQTSRTADEYGVILRSLLSSVGVSEKQIAGSIVCNVVPPLDPVLRKAVETTCGIEPLLVGPGVDTGVKVCYDPVEEVGPDRVVNAAAAFHIYGGPAIVVDYGTATTFDAVSAEGHYIGGAIAPGVGISMEALFSRAARLRRIELKPPIKAIGSSMTESLRSGILYGFAGQTDEMVRRFQSELGSEAKVIATGGLAELIAPETRTVQHINPWLTLQGLKIIWDRQKQL